MQADLPAAMKARDRARVSALRIALSAIANAEAVDLATVRDHQATEAARRALTHDHVVAIVAGVRDEFHNAAEELRGHGRHDEAEVLETQAGVIASYLRQAATAR